MELISLIICWYPRTTGVKILGYHLVLLWFVCVDVHKTRYLEHWFHLHISYCYLNAHTQVSEGDFFFLIMLGCWLVDWWVRAKSDVGTSVLPTGQTQNKSEKDLKWEESKGIAEGERKDDEIFHKLVLPSLVTASVLKHENCFQEATLLLFLTIREEEAVVFKWCLTAWVTSTNHLCYSSSVCIFNVYTYSTDN